MVINDTPHRIALGCAIGVVVSFQPIVGIQMVIGSIFCLILRGNMIASWPPAWITNPFTVVPIFFFTYRLGAIFTGGSKSWQDIKGMVDQINATFDIGFFAGLDRLGQELGQGLFVPMIIGGAIVGVVTGPLSYWLVKRAAERYQHRRAERRLHWQLSGEKKHREKRERRRTA